MASGKPVPEKQKSEFSLVSMTLGDLMFYFLPLQGGKFVSELTTLLFIMS